MFIILNVQVRITFVCTYYTICVACKPNLSRLSADTRHCAFSLVLGATDSVFPPPSSLHFSLGRCSPFLMDLLTRAHKSSRPYNPVSIIFDYLGCALRVYNNIKKPYLVAQSRLYYIRSRSGAYIYIYIILYTYYIRIHVHGRGLAREKKLWRAARSATFINQSAPTSASG